jgi:Spy/CpxP family protein refolding chaperone
MKRSSWFIIGACLLVGITAFLMTVNAAPSAASTTNNAAPLCRWLALSPTQQQEITQADPTFDADSASLGEKVLAARDTLASMMEAPNPVEADVLAQVDRVSAAENALQRRVTQYVLRIRNHLTNQQQLNLMGLCANAVRGQGYGGGRGMGRGGMGGGYGRGYRGGRGAQ